MAAEPTKLVKIANLHLDLKNPRFGLFEARDEDEALQYLVDKENIKELWGSIAARGFEPFEPLIGIRDPDREGHFTIIEGNRRLAACMSILDPGRLTTRQRTRLPKVRDAFLPGLKMLPVAVVASRGEASAYIGFKHVNGPSTWSSLAKAKFGVEMLASADQGLSKSERMATLTQELGDSRGMLLRVFVAYKIFEQAISFGLIGDEEGMLPKDLEFSHLYTMINNPETRSFLGLGREPLTEEDVRDNPIPPEFQSKLEELLKWLFGDNKVIKSQGSDRPKLQKVIASESGLEALRSSGDLNYAYAAAGLQKDDWLANLFKCAALAKQVENDVLELSEDFSSGDHEAALKQATQITKYMRGLLNKLSVRNPSDPL